MTQTADLDWQDATLPPQPSRAQRQKQLLDEKYARTLAKEQAKRDAAAQANIPEPLLRLATALEASRTLIIQQDRKQDRSERAHLAAMQYESFQSIQTDLTALMLRGQLDPAAHREACNSIEQVTKRLFLLAERMDKAWAPVTNTNLKAEVAVRPAVIDSSLLSVNERDTLRGLIQVAMDRSERAAIEHDGGGDGE